MPAKMLKDMSPSKGAASWRLVGETFFILVSCAQNILPQKSVYSIAWNCVASALWKPFYHHSTESADSQICLYKTIQNTSRGILPSGANPDKDPTVTWKYCLM